MITRKLLDLIFEAASIQRWNDHIRPLEFTELDKQAHKAIIAYVLAKYQEEVGDKIDWIYLIEGLLFEFFQRIILTDIKPSVYHKILKEKGKEINSWVVKELQNDLAGISNDFLSNFKKYLLDFENVKLEKRIIDAAHFLATNLEFEIIYNLNPNLYGIERTKREIENKIEDYIDLIGVRKVLLKKKTYNFIHLCGQLRFQQRWTKTPKIPKTYVLGHMLVVSLFTYIFTLNLNPCKKRLYNNFFAALFHDIAEVLTRDIISPVKRSIKGLEDIIKDYEDQQIENELLPLLPTSWHNEFRYFIKDEFLSKVYIDGKIQKVNSSIINEKYNEDRFFPLDGEIIRVADQFAAYIEASLSIDYGISTDHLKKAKEQLYKKYENKIIADLSFKPYFDLFK